MSRFKGKKRLSVAGFRLSPITKDQTPNTEQKGLTLIEILVSLAILSIGILALSHLFPIGLKSSERAANFTRCSSYLQDTIEKLKYAARVYDVGDIPSSPPASPPYRFSDYDGVGYYEFFTKYNAVHGDTTYNPPSGYTSWIDAPFTEYVDSQTKERVGWSHLLLEDEPTLDTDIIQKAYISIYWKESSGVRADTIPLYIANPYRKELGNVLP